MNAKFFVISKFLDDVLLIGIRKFEDDRGWFSEIWNEREFASLGIDARFVQYNESLSLKAGTVRGLHFQSPPASQAKLVRVVSGAIRDVVVDLRRSSPHCGRHAVVEMRDSDHCVLFVPRGFAHGLVTLEDRTVVSYAVDSFYSREHDRGVLWNDPDLSIPWGISPDKAILSERDRALPRLRDVGALF